VNGAWLIPLHPQWEQKHIGIQENIHGMLYLFVQNHYRFTILLLKDGLKLKK